MMCNPDQVAVDADHVVTTDDFRTFFPEFCDATKYPGNLIVTYLQIGVQFVSISRWQQSWKLGACLFAAHELTMGTNATKAAATGVPGQATGIVSAKSVGPVSKSYDTSSAMFSDAGYFNLTTYGQRYWYFMRLFGTGGVQL